MNNLKRKVAIASKIFKAGACIFISLGIGHFSGTLVDMATPFLFTPVDIRVKKDMIASTMLITDRTSLWDAWMGFNLSHGFGVLIFGLAFLLLAHKRFESIVSLKFVYPLCIFVALVYFVLSLIFWFYLPAIGCFSGLMCFVVSFALMKNEWLRGGISE